MTCFLWKSCSLEGGLDMDKIGSRETFSLDGMFRGFNGMVFIHANVVNEGMCQ